MIRLLHILVIVSLPIWVTGKAEQQLVGHFLVLAQYLSIAILGNDVFYSVATQTIIILKQCVSNNTL